MRRIALLVATSGLVGWGLAGALGGCGSDDANIPEAQDGASADDDGSSGNASSSGTSGSSGSSGSSGNPTDGGGTTDAGDGGSSSGSSGNPVSNPNKITCGAVECDAGGLDFNNANRCCVRDGGSNPVCSTANACDNDDLQLACDEPADCPSFGGFQQRCCLLGIGGGNGGPGNNDPRSECRGQQQQCGIRLCKTNADCGDAGACNPKKCGIYNVHVCGSPQNCQ